MDNLSKLSPLRAAILKRVVDAATDGDLTEVARWSDAAKECDLLVKESQALTTRISIFEKSIQELRKDSMLPIVERHPKQKDSNPISLSAKAEGAQVRDKWVRTLQDAQKIKLTGHGTRYQTIRRESVGIASANESRLDRWFLGLPDKPTDIVILLCRTSDQQLYDIVLPIADLGDTWEKLGRSNGQVKFNVEKKADTLLLLVSGRNKLNITQYQGNYRPLC